MKFRLQSYNRILLNYAVVIALIVSLLSSGSNSCTVHCQQLATNSLWNKLSSQKWTQNNGIRMSDFFSKKTRLK